MSGMRGRLLLCIGVVTQVALLPAGRAAAGGPPLGPQEIVQAGGLDIDVVDYSVPSYIDWDNDGDKDLVVGQGDGRVSLYLNAPIGGEPAFSSSWQVQADGLDLQVSADGCLGSFPRVVDWDNDGRKDLLVGDGKGKLNLFLNTDPGTDADPVFGAKVFLQVAGSDIDIGSRATLCVVDWDNDGRKDVVTGDLAGDVSVFLNGGTDAAPVFLSETILFDAGSRSSVEVVDLDRDGDKDLLLGNTGGELRFYTNTGSDEAPSFSGYECLESEGVKIVLGTRTRPFVTDWTGDGLLDVLVGDDSGKVYLYQGVPEPATAMLLALGACVGLFRRKR